MRTLLNLAATLLNFQNPFFKSRVSLAGAVCPRGAFSNVQRLVQLVQLGMEWYWHLEASGAAEHPTTHTKAPTAKNYLAQNTDGGEVEKLFKRKESQCGAKRKKINFNTSGSSQRYRVWPIILVSLLDRITHFF